MERRFDQLRDMKQQEQNRLKSGVSDPVVIESLQENLKHLEDQIKALMKKIKEHVDQHPDLREKQNLLTSIPGIGMLTAIKLIAEIGEIEDFTSAPQLAAYAG
jgi:transposase